MATIIDALVVTLGLDPKGFKAGSAAADASLGKTEAAAKKTAKTIGDVEKAKKAEAKATAQASQASSAAESKAAKEAEARGKTVAMAFSKIRNEALALVGVFTAGMGIKNFAESTIVGAASLGLMSTNLNMSTEKLSAWQRAAERAGGTAEGITAQLQESASESAKAKAGEGTSTSAKFYAMGGDPKALANGNTFLLARSKIVADLYKTDKARAQLVASQMGISEQQFNLIKQGPDAILALVAAQEKHSAVSDVQAAQALELKNKWDDLTTSFKVGGTTIILELMPAIEKIIATFQKWADYIVAHKDDIKKWVDAAIPKVEALFKSFANGNFDQTAKDLQKMAKAFGAVADSILKLIGLLPKLDDSSFIKTLNGLFGSGETTIRPGSVADKLGKIFNMDNVKGLFSGLSDTQVLPSAKGVSSNSANVMQKLIGMGWTPEQAAGIAGSLKQESGLDPAARNKTSGAYGIGQWLGSRVQDFKNFTGKDLVGSSLDDQLKFQQFELTKGKEKSAGDRLRGATSAADAARIHSQYYERPGDAEANIAQRQANAAAFLQQQQSTSAMSAVNTPTGARAAAPVRGGSTSTSSAETNINGPITIHTAATDADGIAKDFAARIRNYSFVSQANTGLA